MASADAPVPVDYRAYNGWNRIITPVLSDDGATLAYVLNPEDGDPALVVETVATGASRRTMRAKEPAFAAGGRFVVFTYTAPIADIDAAKRAHKSESERPKSGVGLWDLNATAPPELIKDIKTIGVAHDGGSTIAYLAEPAPSPSPAPGASPAAKVDKEKAKPESATLTIRNLTGGTPLEVENVASFALSDNDKALAYAVQTPAGLTDGVYVYDIATGKTTQVARGSGRYRALALARDGSSLAFLSDASTYAAKAPHDALYIADLRAATPAAHKSVDTDTPGMTAGTAPSANGDVTFSRDGQRIFFGTAAAPTPAPSKTLAPTAVDIWSWNDDVLQSQQRHDADMERKRTYLAEYDLAAAHFAQLGSPALRDVEVNTNPAVALGRDVRPYRRANSWLGETYADAYAVSLRDGSHKLLATHVSQPGLSPGGRYALYWAEPQRHWIAVRTSDGRRVTLGTNAATRFELEDDDRPAPASPYGMGRWIAGDRGVMLYDRYDVWLANPDTGAAVDITRGAGRAQQTVYSPILTDPDALAFDPDKPMLLGAVDMRSFASGFASVSPSGGTPRTLLIADKLVNGDRGDFGDNMHDLTLPPVKARNADRYAFTLETLRERNLYTSDGTFAHPVPAADPNPQQARYRWATERLISYKATDGTPLRAILMIPDGLPRDRSAPMLVYFYERYTPTFHTYYRPAPGTSPNFIRYVSNGYVVLLPDVVYRPGHPGKSALNCILPAVDAAVQTGYVNDKRVGIAGHSWAAYQINYMLTKTHRFRAAEAGAAVDDMFSAYAGIRLESGVVREAQYEHGQSRIGATPWERPDLYFENSGLFGIANVTTPYLTIHNDRDGAVPQFQGIEFYTAMRRLGKVAYLFSFDGEEHGLRNRENQKYWTVHLDEWFDYWLKGAPRPSWMDGVDYLHRGERDMDAIYGPPST